MHHGFVVVVVARLCEDGADINRCGRGGVAGSLEEVPPIKQLAARRSQRVEPGNRHLCGGVAFGKGQARRRPGCRHARAAVDPHIPVGRGGARHGGEGHCLAHVGGTRPGYRENLGRNRWHAHHIGYLALLRALHGIVGAAAEVIRDDAGDSGTGAEKGVKVTAANSRGKLDGGGIEVAEVAEGQIILTGHVNLAASSVQHQEHLWVLLNFEVGEAQMAIGQWHVDVCVILRRVPLHHLVIPVSHPEEATGVAHHHAHRSAVEIHGLAECPAGQVHHLDVTSG